MELDEDEGRDSSDVFAFRPTFVFVSGLGEGRLE